MNKGQPFERNYGDSMEPEQILQDLMAHIQREGAQAMVILVKTDEGVMTSSYGKLGHHLALLTHYNSKVMLKIMQGMEGGLDV